MLRSLVGSEMCIRDRENEAARLEEDLVIAAHELITIPAVSPTQTLYRAFVASGAEMHQLLQITNPKTLAGKPALCSQQGLLHLMCLTTPRRGDDWWGYQEACNESGDQLAMRVMTTQFKDTSTPTLVVMAETVIAYPARAVFMVLGSMSDAKAVAKKHHPWSCKLVSRVASPDKDELEQNRWALKVVNQHMWLDDIGEACDFCCGEFLGTLEDASGGTAHVVAMSSIEHWLCRGKRGIERCGMRFAGWHIVERPTGGCNVSFAVGVVPTEQLWARQHRNLHAALASTVCDAVRRVSDKIGEHVCAGDLDVAQTPGASPGMSWEENPSCSPPEAPLL
eukprot:TRINITY_DN27260_c0_g1_i1.p1 TRINITY_DN27260_c0_g1~~TRINITY_DN27260_c0_g1_i1.p1  ORF type:complete len:337 (-),score=77.96 TRINITY_DN27260_c0_g1_i1:422-1432(-)